jgi:hypothetical protein
MSDSDKDIVIVIAWPDKRVRLTPGTKWVEHTGFRDAKDGTIRAGHAGCIIVNASSGLTKYYDYGRYGKTPNKGIVRCSTTHALSVPNAKIDNDGNISNLDAILIAIAGKSLFSDYGKMIASVCKEVNYKKMYDFAENLRSKGETPYGPFQYGGSNCARFVQDLILAGSPEFSVRVTVATNVTPSPEGNVENADTDGAIYTVENGELSSDEAAGKLKRHTRASRAEKKR